MLGLLYKDFISAKGKILVIALIIWTLITFVLRIAMDVDGADFLIFGQFFYFILILYMFLISRFETGVIAADEGKKQRAYYLSLPVSRNTFVASKYFFILLAFIAVLTVSVLNGLICQMNCSYETVLKLTKDTISLLPVFASCMLIIPAIELPFFIGLGTKRGNQIKQAIVVMLFFLAIVYLLFGDLSIFNNINLVSVINWMNEHKKVFRIIKVTAPCISLVLYFLSYRLSCLLFSGSRQED